MKFMLAVMYFLIGPYVRTSPLQYIKDTFLCVEAVTSGSTPRKSPPEGSFWRDFFKLLQCHWDGFNDKSSPYRKCICVFKFLDEDFNLWSLIGYTRSSVTKSFVALDNLMKARDILVDKYRDDEYFGPSCTFINPVHHEPYIIEHQPFIMPELVAHKTHFDPDMAFKGVYYMLIHLQAEFELNFLELFSLMCTIDIFGHNPYYFISASILYIKNVPDNKRSNPCLINNTSKFSYGVNFAWKFLNFQQKLFLLEHLKSAGRNVPFLHHRYTSKPTKDGKSYKYTNLIQKICRQNCQLIFSTRN